MKIVTRIFLVLAFVAASVLIIAFARGYRLDFKKQSLTPTGIIAVSAYPRASKVYINGELKGVTDINLTLPPGSYEVEVKKDGYTSWKKTVLLQGELVPVLDILLYPLNPSLSPLTNLSVSRAIPIDQSDKVLLFSESGDETKDGIYLFESNKGPISFFTPLKLIVLKKNLTETLGEINLKDAEIIVSPDVKEAIFSLELATGSVSYLLGLEGENTSFFDITSSRETLLEAWSNQREEITQKILQAYPVEVAKVATDSFRVIQFSPDETKVLYQAKDQVTLPKVIEPDLIAANQTPQVRDLVPDSLYVYDKKEDKNYEIPSFNFQVLLRQAQDPEQGRGTISNQFSSFNLPSSISWYSDSKHLVINEGKKISFMDFDGENKQTVYSGNFEESFYKVTGDGKLLILTNLNPEANKLPDLYAVGIR